eukprot:5008365-Pleurochrysis_carterae.AAC.1
MCAASLQSDQDGRLRIEGLLRTVMAMMQEHAAQCASRTSRGLDDYTPTCTLSPACVYEVVRSLSPSKTKRLASPVVFRAPLESNGYNTGMGE